MRKNSRSPLYIYIYIYNIYSVCVCVCVCMVGLTPQKQAKPLNKKEKKSSNPHMLFKCKKKIQSKKKIGKLFINTESS